VYAPWFLKESLLPDGWLSGWSPDWYAGFPFLHFYFPLTILIQALLSYVIPYEIAFKIGTVLGTFFMPFAFYALFRLLRFRWPAPLAAALGAMAFLFMDSFNIFGGNILSSFAGEYSFSLSVGLCMVFYGLAYREAVDDKGRPLLAAGVLALAVLNHLIPVIMVALSTPLLLWWSVQKRGPAATARRFGIIFGVAFSLTAFWSIPFVVRLGYTTNMRWGGYEGLGTLFPRELWLYHGLALAGGIVAWARHDRRVLLLALPGTIGALLYLWLPDGHIWNGRFVPFWHITVVAVAAYALGALIPVVSRSVWKAKSNILAALLTVCLVVASCGYILWDKRTTYIDYWIEWNFEGYESKDDYPVFERLNGALAELPRGRVMWEPGDALGRFGTPIALMALPYFADQPTMEGIYFESSVTTPFHFIMASAVAEAPSNPIRDLPYNEFDLERGIDQMELFDVAYFVAFSEEAVDAAAESDRLEEIDVVDDYHIYEVGNQGPVLVPDYEPVVYSGPDWFGNVTRWFADGDLDVPFVKEGPEAWARARDYGDLDRQSIRSPIEIETEVGQRTIRFTTDAIGQPHWIKTSYFPNWKVDGAEGPFEGAPSLMFVVPTEETVTLTYSRTWAEWLGLLLTLSALAVVIARPLRRRVTELSNRP
jgi:hypothetical protein